MRRPSNTVNSRKLTPINTILDRVGVIWLNATGQSATRFCVRGTIFSDFVLPCTLHLLALHLALHLLALLFSVEPASPAALSHMECARKARASDAWLHKHCLSDTNTALNTSITILSLHTSTMNVNHVCHERCFQHSLGQDNIVSLDCAHNENEWKHG